MAAKWLLYGTVGAIGVLVAGVALAGGLGGYAGLGGDGGHGYGPHGKEGRRFHRAGGGGGDWFGFGHGPGAGLHHLIDDLELTEEQKGAIREALRASYDRMEPLMAQAHEAKRGVFEAAHAEVLDEGALRRASEAAGSAVTNLSFEMARGMAGVLAVLTPEQRQELEEKVAKRRDRGGERSERFREHRRERFEEFLESL